MISTEDDLRRSTWCGWRRSRAPLTPRRGPRCFPSDRVDDEGRGWIALASTTGAGGARHRGARAVSPERHPRLSSIPILQKRGTTSAATRPFAAHSRSGLAIRDCSVRGVAECPFVSDPGWSGDTGVGYLLQSPDGVSLCLVLREVGAAGLPGSLVHSAFGPVVCTSTAGASGPAWWRSAAQPHTKRTATCLAALIPAGATVELTDDGTTTSVPVNDGIATGVAPPTATLTTNIAGVAQTTQLAASAEPWWPPTASSASGATSSASTSGSTEGSGATATSGTTRPTR